MRMQQVGCKKSCREGSSSREGRKEESQDNVEKKKTERERENTCENISLERPLMLFQLSETLLQV